MSVLINSRKFQPPAVDLTLDLKSYWKLDEASGSSADAVGTNTLSAANAPVSMTGKVGDGRAFVAASGQALRVSSPSNLAFGTSDFSISFWFRYSGSVANNILINWGNQVMTTQYIMILLLSGALQVQFIDGLSGFNSMNTGVTFTTNVWHHVSLTFDRNAYLKTYKNGSLAATNTGITAHQGNVSPSTAFSLGNYGTANSLPLDGGLDEVKIWHRVLNFNEVLTDYNNGVAGNPLL